MFGEQIVFFAWKDLPISVTEAFFRSPPPTPLICVQLLRGKHDLTRWNFFTCFEKIFHPVKSFSQIHLVENVNVSFYCAGLRSNGGQVLTFYTFWRKNQITINLCI